MAQPNLPDDAPPPPPKVALKATPGQFDWISMHPSFSKQGSPSTSPSPAKITTQNHVSPYDANPRGSSRPPPKPTNLKRPGPAIRQSFSSPQNNFNGHAASTYPSNYVAPYQSQFSPNPQASRHLSSNQSIFKRPSIDVDNNLSLLDPFGPDPLSNIHKLHPAVPRTNNDPPSQSVLKEKPPSPNNLDSSILGLPRSLHRAITQTRTSASPAPTLSNLQSASPPADPSQGEPLRQSQTDVEASNELHRNLSRSSSEDIDTIDEDELDLVSSDDEDYREFRASLVKAKNDVASLKGAQQPAGRGRPRNDIPARGGFRGLRGPRRAAEPTGDIKARLGQAAKAFLEGNYLEAKATATEIIRINAETHEAWTTLASVFLELGERNKALTAMTYAAHLEPKNIEGWLSCARLFLEETGKRRKHYLSSAFFCYGAALKIDSKNIEARLGKARIYVERNNAAGAVTEFKKVLPLRPRDVELIRDLCAAYYDRGEFENAVNLYKETFANYMSNPKRYKEPLDWNDVDAYMAIYQQLDQPEAAAIELKSISRYLLGRSSEDFWNDITNNDCEWDSDALRRVEVPSFSTDGFPSSTYGDGLPLELRIKLGLFRLDMGKHEEALRHFEWLKGFDESGEDRLSSYFDLYRLVADKLLAVKLYEQALKFYEPLKQVPDEHTGDLYLQMGYCFLGDKLQPQAEECFQAAIQLDENNIEARMELAKMYESLNEQEQAFIYVNEMISIQSQIAKPVTIRKRDRQQARAEEQRLMQSKELSDQSSDDADDEETPAKHSQYKRRRLADPNGKAEEEKTRTEQLQLQYRTLRREHEQMRNGNREATRAWVTAARELTNDFRSVRSFYPYDSYIHFLGYKTSEASAGEVTLGDELSTMAERLSQQLGADVPDKTRVPKIDMPADYRGISFGAWLDIFIDFALCLARTGKMKQSYEICEAVKDCALWYHSREDLFLIHVCWMTCALLSCDEETCVNVARFFMKDYQFTSDAYRMFTAISRTVHSPVSWYSSGPSQKYILRQIKAMDYALVDEESRQKYFDERGAYSAVDEKGQKIINNDLDIPLLMLYGHILYTGSSYFTALNYFLRALALDPENPMINLNVGLAYVHHALKRLAENRQYLILQGLTFLFNYYNSRKTSPKLEERQEAHYNMARVYHMLGLTSLAIPYYDLVFKEIEEGGREQSREDLVTDAAFNLQSIYATSGNEELARMITKKWLVI